MRFANSIFMLCTGAIIGVLLVLSCGDDSIRRADAGDAASCNCPAAEPPLASRIAEVIKPLTLPANSMDQVQSVACPLNALVFTGGCSANVGQLPNIILEQSYTEGIGWTCVWRNPSNADVPVRAIVRCLMPAQ